MAKEKWTVFYEIEDPGTQNPANWKEKDIVTKAGEKNSGLLASEQTVSIKEGSQLNTTVNSRTLETTALKTNSPQHARFVTIEAEGAEEAAEAVRIFYGQPLVTNKFLAVKSASLEEPTPQP